MQQLNNQPVLFTASGMLSAAVGPNGVTFPTTTAPIQESTTRRQWRISGIKVVKIGASGSVQVFDSNTNNPVATKEVYEADVTEVATNLGIICKSGDIFVKITGGFKVWLYLDINA